MPGTYNANANAVILADAVAMNPKLKGELFAKYLEVASQQHNAFAKFTTDQEYIKGMNGGVSSIFVSKKDLKARGGDTVNLSVMGPPGGPGAMGSQELTGRTSTPKLNSYLVKVGYHRDAVEYSEDTLEFLAAGGRLEVETADMLSKKMGLLEQNHMMMRLILEANGNVFRPNNRATTDDLLATDTLSLAIATAGKARLNTIGGRPIMHKLAGSTGSPVTGYLNFFSDQAMLNLHNDDGYTNAISNGDIRGDANANFTGELVKWKGMAWYEQPSRDEDWDGSIGSPMQPKLKLSTAFSTASAAGSCVLRSHASNTTTRYTEFWPGHQYAFQETEVAAADNTAKYAWGINPDGSVGFIEYLGSANNGNLITVNKILSKNGAGTSTKGATVVGQISVNTTASPDEWTGGDGNLPVGPTYTDSFAVGAIFILANAKGTQIGRGFIFGAQAAAYGYGRINKVQIEQERDYGMVHGRGFKTIFGSGLCLNALGKPAGYLLCEVAMEHEGFPTPVPDFD